MISHRTYCMYVAHHILYNCCRLILTSLDLGAPQHIMMDAYDICLRLCLQHLNSDLCICRIRVSWSNCKGLVTVAKSILATKQWAKISSTQQDHLAFMVVQVVHDLYYVRNNNLSYLYMNSGCSGITFIKLK